MAFASGNVQSEIIADALGKELTKAVKIAESQVWVIFVSRMISVFLI